MTLAPSSRRGPVSSPAASAPPRRGYIDWLRGLAILIMIETHVLDAWTRAADRNSATFGFAKVLGGFAAPLFLFLAGVAVVLAVRAQLARTGDAALAARAVQRRGWQIFVLAFLFRFQAIALNPAALPQQMLKVDILNIMGPAIVMTAVVCGVSSRHSTRLVMFGAATAFMTLATPVVRDTPFLAWLPDPVEAYLRPVPGHDDFNLFPWAGFVFAGGLLATLLDRSRTREREAALHAALAVGGLVLAVASYYAWYLPSPYRHTEFWSTSPAFFFMRTAILAAALGLAYFQPSAPAMTAVLWRPLQRFGRSSLLVYWVHVELVYGVATNRLHHRLSVDRAIAGFVLLTLAMYALAVVKQFAAARWKERRRALAQGERRFELAGPSAGC